MTTTYTRMDSPVGILLLTSDGTSITRLLFNVGDSALKIDPSWVRDDSSAPLAAAREQLAAYFAGERTSFDVAIAPQGTEFQKRVWQELLKIPYGRTISYGELARRIGNSNASRAVGLANGRNPISIIVPCHRVIGADGSLTGFGGGMANKRILLDLERRHSDAPARLAQQTLSLA